MTDTNAGTPDPMRDALTASERTTLLAVIAASMADDAVSRRATSIIRTLCARLAAAEQDKERLIVRADSLRSELQSAMMVVSTFPLASPASERAREAVLGHADSVLRNWPEVDATRAARRLAEHAPGTPVPEWVDEAVNTPTNATAAPNQPGGVAAIWGKVPAGESDDEFLRQVADTNAARAAPVQDEPAREG